MGSGAGALGHWADVPPPTGMTGNFGQIFLGHGECWRPSCVFIFSQLVACRWAGKTQTTLHLGTPSPPWIRTTPLIYCCVRRMHHVPVSILSCLWVVFTVLTFLQRNTCRNAGCNRKLLNEKNGFYMPTWIPRFCPKVKFIWKESKLVFPCPWYNLFSSLPFSLPILLPLPLMSLIWGPHG